jgi:Rieske Fe-S protein
MRRRNFIRLATGVLALGTANFLGRDGEAETPKPYQRVKLVDEHGHGIKTAALEAGEGYLFFYPYRSTPCFLLNLGAGQDGPVRTRAPQNPCAWPGGVGLGGSIVAYAAICTHQVTRPSPRKSFINYRPRRDESGEASGRITCCLHGSMFDPAQGGKVVGGPAPQPLTTIKLDHDEENDELYAVGTHGGEVYKAYFKAYRRELRQEFGPALVRQESSGEAVVMRLSNYTKRQFFC